MARVTLSLFLLSCTLLQYALAEFGSIGTVQSSGTIKNAAIQTTLLFDNLDENNGYVPLTDYDLFSTVLPLIESLGTQVAELGTTITTAISTGVPMNDGNLDGVFDPIMDAITPLIDLIDGEQEDTRTSLTTLLGEDIDHLFGDVFGNMRIALEEVEIAFGELKQALSTAPIISGRARLPAGVVGAVLGAVNVLRATVLPVEYTIFTTIDNVQMGDQFLYDLEDISIVLESDLQLYLSEFTAELEDIGDAVEAVGIGLQDQLTAVVDGLDAVTTSLSALPEYADFSTALDQYSLAIDTLEGLPDQVLTVYQDYLSTADTYLDQYAAVLIPRSYLSITFLLEVLIAGGPYSQFCFFKYSPRLVNYYSILASDVEACFNLENERLYFLLDTAEALAELILYDVEDLVEYLSLCNDSTAPGDCIASISSYYLALFTATTEKAGFFLELATAEASASINRLGACIYVHKMKNVQQLFAAKQEIIDCRTEGPNVPE